MATHLIETAGATYAAVVERGCVARIGEFVPERRGKIFVVATRDVWDLHGKTLSEGLRGHDWELLYFPGGEVRKRLAEVETLAEQMLERGGDRSSLVIGFGGGIVTDVAGFLAAIFMRGVPVIQVPTTLLAQVDASMGGKTGVNLAGGKNLIGSFHQPLHVLIDPAVLHTLPEREYRAGLFEVVKHGIIANADLFHAMCSERDAVLAREPEIVERMITDSVLIKSEVVSADYREGGLRRILNFGHTFGHALEAETEYSKFLHGEAVAWGMRAATLLARLEGILAEGDADAILDCIERYGPFPSLEGIRPMHLFARLKKDKKTIQGTVHFVLPERIGKVRVTSQVNEHLVLDAIEGALRG